MTSRRPLGATVALGVMLVALGHAQQTRSSVHDGPAVGYDRLYYLDLAHGGRVLSASTDGTDVRVVSPARATGPDGIVVDRHVTTGSPLMTRLYWTTMGRVDVDDGTIESSDLDGGDPRTVVPRGGTFTPKQIKTDGVKIYWADREGMRIMRANRDGSGIETLVETGRGDAARQDARNWCVGIALDVSRRQMYWTQKGSGGNGRIFRASMELSPGESPAHRSDVELLFDGLPEPIDMDVDLSTRLMYWTDRGDPPRGNTVNRAPMDPPAHVDPSRRNDQDILFGGLKEGIGIAIDVPRDRLFVTDLGGNVYRSRLDGSERNTILAGQGTLTGIAYLPPR